MSYPTIVTVMLIFGLLHVTAAPTVLSGPVGQIPAGQTIFTLTPAAADVPSTGKYITKLEIVNLQVTHPDISQLTLELSADAGGLTLLSQSCFGTTIKTCFSDASTLAFQDCSKITSLTTCLPPVGIGHTSLNSQFQNGDITTGVSLTITNSDPTNKGNLVSWSISFETICYPIFAQPDPSIYTLNGIVTLGSNITLLVYMATGPRNVGVGQVQAFLTDLPTLISDPQTLDSRGTAAVVIPAGAPIGTHPVTLKFFPNATGPQKDCGELTIVLPFPIIVASVSTTYTATIATPDIPDGGSAQFPVNVSALPAQGNLVTAVEVQGLVGTYANLVGDLTFSLIHPNGVKAAVLWNVPFCAASNFNFCVSDLYTPPWATSDDCGPETDDYSKCQTSTQPLSVFKGLPAPGQWKLKVSDSTPDGNNGQVTSFILKVYTAAGKATVSVSGVGVAQYPNDVVFTAHVTSSLGIPTGRVTFKIDNVNAAFGVNLPLTNGLATYTAKLLSGGVHLITASYDNVDGNWGDAVTTSALRVVVAAAPTVIVLQSGPTGAAVITFKFKITIKGKPTPVRAGQLTVKLNGKVLTPIPVPATGVVVLRIPKAQTITGKNKNKLIVGYTPFKTTNYKPAAFPVIAFPPV